MVRIRTIHFRRRPYFLWTPPVRFGSKPYSVRQCSFCALTFCFGFTMFCVDDPSGWI
ncbi:hypothetical protein B0H12DRAFT_166938 [Mycena haematopus]|nr:hypothetical protein B0H12DRAFT_166938 [Mycena haematopus]